MSLLATDSNWDRYCNVSSLPFFASSLLLSKRDKSIRSRSSTPFWPTFPFPLLDEFAAAAAAAIGIRLGLNPDPLRLFVLGRGALPMPPGCTGVVSGEGKGRNLKNTLL